jgi:hypothetical protein
MPFKIVKSAGASPVFYAAVAVAAAAVLYKERDLLHSAFKAIV